MKLSETPHLVELKCQKHNMREEQQPRRFKFDWTTQGLKDATVSIDFGPLVHRVRAALLGKARDVATITDLLNAEGDEQVTTRQVYDALKHHAVGNGRRAELFTRQGDGWELT